MKFGKIVIINWWSMGHFVWVEVEIFQTSSDDVNQIFFQIKQEKIHSSCQILF